MGDTWLWWSSGKDSAWALHELRRGGQHRVTRLVTTIEAEASRVAMHAVRQELVAAQARSLALPLECIALPFPPSNARYEAAVAEVVAAATRAGVSAMAFGDLFLEDIRAYRCGLLAGSGIEPLFPLWGRPTATLAREMVDAGLEAHLISVDLRVLDPSFAGARFDHALLERLPDGVDPCGENGEFHTFASGGPMFDRAVSVRAGAVEQRDGFAFADLAPGASWA